MLTSMDANQARIPGQTKGDTDGRANPGSSAATSNAIGKNCDTCGGKKDGRNLVVCIDGTSNRFGIHNTNIVELYRHLIKSEAQLTYYNSGIGTLAQPGFKSLHYWRQVIDHNIDLAFAWNFEKIVLGAYRWLADNYREGDRIYLYGFSRGAYQVRALSAMIDRVGLISRGNEEQIPFAYEVYASLPDIPQAVPLGEDQQGDAKNGRRLKKWRDMLTSRMRSLSPEAKPSEATLSGDPSKKNEEIKRFTSEATHIDDRAGVPVTSAEPESEAVNARKDLDDAKSMLTNEGVPETNPIRPRRSLAENFKITFCRDSVKVHFVGAWDTVSSIGFLRNKLLPHTSVGMKHVCFFRHALALDEHRVKFMPEYAHGGVMARSPTPAPSGGGLSNDSKGAVPAPQIKEVWFRGSHSDIGGGNAENADMNRGVPSLRWLSYESTQAGLHLHTFDNSQYTGWDKPEINSSMTGLWWLLEVLPLQRLSYKDASSVTWWPHFGCGRQIQPGQLIHHTVIHEDEDPTQKRRLPGAFLPSEHANWRSYKIFNKNDNASHRSELFVNVEKDLYNVCGELVKQLGDWKNQSVERRRALHKDLENAILSAEHLRALKELFESTQKASTTRLRHPKDILSEAFERLTEEILQRAPVPKKRSSFSDPEVSLCISSDIRLFVICLKLLKIIDKGGDSEKYRIKRIRVLQPGKSSASNTDVAWTTEGFNSKDVMVMASEGSEFFQLGDAPVMISFPIDDIVGLSASLSQTSYLYSHLRSGPPLSPGYRFEFWRKKYQTGLKSPTITVHSDVTPKSPPVKIGVKDPEGIWTRYQLRMTQDENLPATGPLYYRVFGIEMPFSIFEKTSGWRKWKAGRPNIVEIGEFIISTEGPIEVSFYKIIISDKPVSNLEDIQMRYNTTWNLFTLKSQLTTIDKLCHQSDANYGTYHFAVTQYHDESSDPDEPDHISESNSDAEKEEEALDSDDSSEQSPLVVPSIPQMPTVSGSEKIDSDGHSLPEAAVTETNQIIVDTEGPVSNALNVELAPAGTAAPVPQIGVSGEEHAEQSRNAVLVSNEEVSSRAIIRTGGETSTDMGNQREIVRQDGARQSWLVDTLSKIPSILGLPHDL